MSLTRFVPLLVVLAALPQAHATVQLNSTVVPSAGQPAVTTLTLMGSGFPSGTIPPANVTVSLQPAIPAAGPSATTPATAVQVVLGTTCRVTFQIPVSIVVTAPAVYAVSISGTTSGGAAFSSSNTAALTVNPGPQIASVLPGSANAGSGPTVTITGLFTNFLQGATEAGFGPGVAVGGAASGQAGPVTVTSPTVAVAQLVIREDATPGAQTVTVTTGVQQASLTNGFTILPPLTKISIDTSATTSFPSGFSGFNQPHLINGVEYFDPKFVTAVQPMRAGFIRFPAGTAGIAFDWQTGHTNMNWLNSLVTGDPPPVDSLTAYILRRSQKLTQAKGGVYLSDFATFASAAGADGLICFNAYTDTNIGSAFTMVGKTSLYGLKVREWELANEPYFFRRIFPTARSYATAMRSYYTGISAGDPTAKVGLFYAGLYTGVTGDFSFWDTGMAAYSPKYWNAVSVHLYPIATSVSTGTLPRRQITLSDTDERATLNGILAHGISQYLTSYLPPLIGSEAPIFITEFNSDGMGTSAFAGSLYNGVFLAEAIARLTTIPNVQGVAVQALFYGNSGYFGMILAENDYEDYLISQVTANPNFSTNTATDPNTQFSFFYSAPGLALQVANQAINNSTHAWPTTVAFSPTVPILGFDGNPIPAVYAQAYQGDNSRRYLLITNKSGLSLPVNVEVDDSAIPGPLSVTSASHVDPNANNNPAAQNNVQIVSTTSDNPVTLGPYSVTRIEW